METSKALTDKVNMWLMATNDKLPAEKIGFLKSNLEKLEESKVDNLMTIEMKSPMTLFIICWFLGFLSIDRFMLGNPGVAIARLLTIQGLGLWWLIDLITTMKRTKEYNYNKIRQSLGIY